MLGKELRMPVKGKNWSWLPGEKLGGNYQEHSISSKSTLPGGESQVTSLLRMRNAHRGRTKNKSNT